MAEQDPMAQRDPCTLLLVEDERIVALRERSILERHGYRVEVVHTGEAAIARVDAAPGIDLILMDIDLGLGMDGTDAAGKILASRDVPIVFLTSHSEPEYFERVKNITGYGYVLKESGEFVLVQSIEMALRLWGVYEEARAEKEQYRLITENIRETVLVVDPAFRISYVSPSIEQLTGFSPAAYREMRPEEALTESSAAVVAELRRRQHADPLFSSGPIELERRCRDGSTVWTETESRPIVNGRGEVKGHVATIRDISDRMRLEEDLQRSLARLEATLDAIPELIFELDGQLRFRDYRAPPGRRLYRDPDEFIGRRVEDVLSPEVSTEVARAIEKSRRGVTPATFDYSLVDNDRQRFFRASVARQEKRPDERFVVIAYEVTDLVEARRKLEEALERNGRLLQEIHHRVKNNLALVSSLIALTEESSSCADLSDLRRQLDAVRFIHEQLQSVENSNAVALDSYLSNLLEELFATRPHAGIELEVDAAGLRLESGVAVTIGLIANEMATNAMKHAFGSEGGERFSLTLRPEGEDLIFRIANSGTPFPEGLDPENAGSLGLQLISGLVRQLDGTMELAREPNTAFTIRFPRRERTL